MDHNLSMWQQEDVSPRLKIVNYITRKEMGVHLIVVLNSLNLSFQTHWLPPIKLGLNRYWVSL